MTGWQRILGATALLCLSACARQSVDHAAPQRVPPHAFALVGDRPLPLTLLNNIEPGRREKLSERIVRNELFRKEAEAEALSSVAAVRRGVLSRRLLQALQEESLLAHPLTDAELEAARERNWLRFDRPRAVRGVDLFFEVPLLADDRPAYAKAEKAYEAVKDVTNLQDFVEKARAAIQDDSVQAFEMPPLAADGRIVEMLPQDRGFQSAPPGLAPQVAALKAPGDVSGIIGTEGGFHLVYVTEVIPALRPPLEEIRDELQSSVLSGRIREMIDSLRLEEKTKIERRREDIARLLQLVQRSK